MSKFSLDNFTKKTEEIKLPIWAIGKEKVSNLYLEFLNRSQEIEELLKESKDVAKLSVKERKIVPAQLTDKFGYDRSEIRRSRLPEFVELINNENTRLNELYENLLSDQKQTVKLTRKQLEDKIQSLETEIKTLKQIKLHEYFDRAVASQVTEKNQQLAEKVIELDNLYKDQVEKNAKLDKKIKELIRELNSSNC